MKASEANSIKQYIQLRGSTTLLSSIQAIGSQYMDEYPSIGLPLLGGGTSAGYKSVLDGTADIGMASGAMPEDMEIWATAHKRAVRSINIAYDGIAVIVNASNSITNLSLVQLRDIFTGRVGNWNEVSKLSGKINVYSHHPQRGTYEPWKRLVVGKEHITLGAQIVNDHKELFADLLKDPLGISYVSTTFLGKANLKVLSVNDFLPTYENLRANQYPIRNNLLLIAPEQTSDQVKQFIDYCLNPSKGQALIKKNGLVPIVTG
ncbi:phosphate ABC transporter substrate-binding protein [Polynucleobacter paludilacus]|uniref:phosphate ABC transporter substrate-binding protein n=1 Tax=Polynucleobacter paludilacus TaxID=1855895 RepID=UPI001BFDD777|nr:phosphate ABC transporter substrate-binding protein [Polynucleobacter paludilacus]QWD87499.1 phosphate ABC transporter substrate-binding protein [Polynucleobacter paludilacus]